MLAQYTAERPADVEQCSEHEIGGCLLQLLEATPGLVLAATLQGKLLYLNSKGRALLGIGPDGVARLRLQDIFTTSSYRKVRDEAIPGCLKIGRWQGELALLDAAQREVPVAQLLTSHEVTDGRRRATLICGIAWDMREHKRTETQLRFRATHDELTGLPNRALLLDRLTQGIHAADRHGQRLGVFFLDLDAFKQINDDFGHEAGNELLSQLGARLCARFRASDTVARYGGDEFVLLQPDLRQPADVERGARMLLEVLREPFHLGGRTIQVAGSVGVALFPDDGEDAETLLRKADSEMYAVKRTATRRAVSTTTPLRGLARVATTAPTQEQIPSRC